MVAVVIVCGGNVKMVVVVVVVVVVRCVCVCVCVRGTPFVCEPPPRHQHVRLVSSTQLSATILPLRGQTVIP
jgi:hypothetical protein